MLPTSNYTCSPVASSNCRPPGAHCAHVTKPFSLPSWSSFPHVTAIDPLVIEKCSQIILTIHWSYTRFDSKPKKWQSLTPLKSLIQGHNWIKGMKWTGANPKYNPKFCSNANNPTQPSHRQSYHKKEKMCFVPRATTNGVPTTEVTSIKKNMLDHASLFPSDNSPSTSSHPHLLLIPVLSVAGFAFGFHLFSILIFFGINLFKYGCVQCTNLLRPRNSEGICPFWHRKVLPPGR